MKLFSCKVRLGGSMLNEVHKHNVTPAEVVLLRAVHGDDAVLSLEHTGNVNRSDAKERARLSGMYSHTTPKGVLHGPDLVRTHLGIGAQKLPADVPEIVSAAIEDEPVIEDEPEEIVPVAPIVRTKIARKAPADLTA